MNIYDIHICLMLVFSYSDNYYTSFGISCF